MDAPYPPIPLVFSEAGALSNKLKLVLQHVIPSLSHVFKSPFADANLDTILPLIFFKLVVDFLIQSPTVVVGFTNLERVLSFLTGVADGGCICFTGSGLSLTTRADYNGPMNSDQ